MVNLLEEPELKLSDYGYTYKDIIYIGNPFSGKYLKDGGSFASTADFEYDNGFGSHFVQLGLRIVFSDGAYLARDEYDGSEGWHLVPNFNWEEVSKHMKPCVCG